MTEQDDKAVKQRKCMKLQVGLPDGRTVQVEGDSASTSSEICDSVANSLGLTDNFGFSIYVAVQNKVSSLGSGMDHVMDAITECEQLMRIEGKSEKDTPWRVFYRKELFTPWHDASIDPVATDLVYRQIVDGIQREEYALPTTEELNSMISRILYIECGPDLDQSEIRVKLFAYYPESLLTRSSKARDTIAQLVFTVYQEQVINGRPMMNKHMKADIVAEATTLWPMHFSAMFEAFRCEKPHAPLTDVIMAVNRDGIFVLGSKYEVEIGFHYYDVIDVSATGCDDQRQSYVRLTIIDGAQYTFFSPNASTIAKMTSVFLDGLRRRSKWVVALQPFVLQDYSKEDTHDLRLRKGDLVNLQDVPDMTKVPYQDWLYGQCARTGVSGFFPSEVIYVLPTVEKPAKEFITMLGTTINQALLDTLPRKHRLGSVVYSDETTERRNVVISKHSIGRYSGHGIESFA